MAPGDGGSSAYSVHHTDPELNAKAIPVSKATGADDDCNTNRDVSGDVIDDGLRRGLKGRHFVIIALGSIIGPGTYWGVGYAIYLSGPLGALLGFIVVGMVVYAGISRFLADRRGRNLSVDPHAIPG